MNQMKSISAMFALALLGSVSAQASTTIAENYDSRDHMQQVSLALNADGKSCTKTTVEGQFRLSTTTETDNSEACTALKIARRIQEKLGSCSPKETEVSSRDTTLGKEQSQYVLGGRGGISFENPHEILTARASQECLCGKLVTVNSNVGPGMVNVLNLVFDGPYYRSDVTLTSVSAQECANLFNSEQEKSAVLDAYKEFNE
jgi:hypothetical protein